MNTVYLSGKFVPQDQATISVMDRGFLFGDGVYEVIPVYNGKIFRFEQHIARLNRSLSLIKLAVAMSLNEWQTILEQLLMYNHELGKNQSIYLQVTRGPEPERNHALPQTPIPTIFIYSYPLKTLSYEQLAEGKSAITLPDNRWQLCNVKATSLLANVLLYQEALSQGCAEAILIREGQAVEGATSNLFIVSQGIIKTPPLSNCILGGVTRDLILQLAQAHQIPSQEINITESELLGADEIWITSSTREIYPIVKLNDQLLNQGQPGPIWDKMIRLYKTYTQEF